MASSVQPLQYVRNHFGILRSINGAIDTILSMAVYNSTCCNQHLSKFASSLSIKVVMYIFELMAPTAISFASPHHSEYMVTRNPYHNGISISGVLTAVYLGVATVLLPFISS